jgi:peptide-methionine (R)-S-oxide reductase
MGKMQKTDDEWEKELTPKQYKILREGGTEAPYSGQLLHNSGSGMYTCAACGVELFDSDVKFDSTYPGLAGWPSFYDAKPGAVEFRQDNSGGMQRLEVTCANCGSHLGHIFPDDSPTGKHYCINSTCLVFRPKKKEQ